MRVLPFAALALFVCVAGTLTARMLDAPAGAQNAAVEICFTPEERCAPKIVAAIDDAKSSIEVMQLFMNQPDINKALIRARKRGVSVHAIVDYESIRGLQHDACATPKPGYIGPDELSKSGVPVVFDNSVKTAHNKVSIIDNILVIGGSYNYTNSAEKRNAENVTFITSESVAKQFHDEWERRLAASEPYSGPSCAPSS